MAGSWRPRNELQSGYRQALPCPAVSVIVTTEFRRRTLGDRHFADQAVTSPTKLPISVFIHDEATNTAERTTVNKRARSRCFGRCRRASASILSVIESRSTARSAARDRATNQRNWAASAPNEYLVRCRDAKLPAAPRTAGSAETRIPLQQSTVRLSGVTTPRGTDSVR